MSLIVVGSVAYDGVETPHGKVDRMLGGAATYISLAASYFTPVKMVAVVGDDFAQEDFDLLASRGIDLDGLERVPGGKTFFWAGRLLRRHERPHHPAHRSQRLRRFQPQAARRPISTRAYLLLGNIQPALQRSVRAQMNGVRLTGGDTMNYWINDFRAELLETLKRVGLPADQRQRSAPAFGRAQPAPRRRQNREAWGRSTLVIKRGEYGAILFHGGRHFMAPGYLLEDVFDPTGAGDCFAGGFIGYLAGRGIQPSNGNLDLAELRRAVIYGSVMGSFCCEKFGVDRFRTLTREEIEARYQEFKSCTAF